MKSQHGSEDLKLPRPSVRKLFREDFCGQCPIFVDRANLSEESRRWRKQIETIEGTHVTRHPGDKDSRSKTLCRFTIPNPAEERFYWRSDELRLEFDEQSRLRISRYDNRDVDLTALVSDLDEIKRFVRHVRERYARRHANAKKRDRVRQFKSNAIIAQVKKLAKEEQFDFATSADTFKWRLYIRVSKSVLMECVVPF
mgnify:FL=1